MANQFNPNLTKRILRQFQAGRVINRKKSIYLSDASGFDIGDVVGLEVTLTWWLMIKNYFGVYSPPPLNSWEIRDKKPWKGVELLTLYNIGTDLEPLAKTISNHAEMMGRPQTRRVKIITNYSLFPPVKGDTVTFKRPSCYIQKEAPHV